MESPGWYTSQEKRGREKEGKERRKEGRKEGENPSIISWSEGLESKG